MTESGTGRAIGDPDDLTFRARETIKVGDVTIRPSADHAMVTVGQVGMVISLEQTVDLTEALAQFAAGHAEDYIARLKIATGQEPDEN